MKVLDKVSAIATVSDLMAAVKYFTAMSELVTASVRALKGVSVLLSVEARLSISASTHALASVLY